MGTVIVRVFDPVDGGDGRLHGSVEVPGGEPVPFDGDRELVAVVRRLGDRSRSPGPGADGSDVHPAERASGGQRRAAQQT